MFFLLPFQQLKAPEGEEGLPPDGLILRKRSKGCEQMAIYCPDSQMEKVHGDCFWPAAGCCVGEEEEFGRRGFSN
ncbi:hypothetical protein CEXT_342761 [Caerostris extrusa]|uniref:Uncharacterized protein n=1 Tax=Caerostris extrusa TaxID=172846 RepID=A0AAV4NQC1_CAEEX|nr:hypothetical protein CEXT_342761 [Caerostris extrusa]